MGEYATFRGESVKLGTCENMYYLRAEQRHDVTGYSFGGDVLAGVRFRFPFPDEDGTEPGAFGDHDRSVRIPGDFKIPDGEGFEHVGSVQFRAEPGYLLSVPCPESSAFAATGLSIHRNGWTGGYGIAQTAYREGEWRVIVTCRSCGARWNVPRSMAEEIAAAFVAEGARQEWRMSYAQDPVTLEWAPTGEYAWRDVHTSAERFNFAETAHRILNGYAPMPVEVVEVQA